MTVRLDVLVLDPRTQPRVQIDSSLVSEYADDRKSGSPFPPVTVFSDGESYWLADGWHRVYAARKLGKSAIEADVRPGSLRDAVLHAMGANASHGARRTNEDKRRAVAALLRDDEWVKWNDSKIARQCHVDHKTVAALRAQAKAILGIPKIADPPPRLVERNGTVYPMKTANIGSVANAANAIAEPQILAPPPVAQTVPHFNKTNDNIGWAQWSWNPVTGCERGCEYCYARDIGMRFDGHFTPTFHESRLEAPHHTNPIMDTPAGRRVFVCSMADLFGTWVPNEWINRVMEKVWANPQWTFLFLTKNPRRYASVVFPGNAWIGATVDVQSRVAATEKAMEKAVASVKFVSCEPLLEAVTFTRPELFEWFLVGAKSEGVVKVQPKSAWTLDIITQAHMAGKRVWMKDNLSLIQEDPHDPA